MSRVTGGNISNIDGLLKANGGIQSNVESGAEGNSGVIDLKANDLSLTNGAQIQTIVRQGNPQLQLAPGNGIAGNIIIDVDELDCQ